MLANYQLKLKINKKHFFVGFIKQSNEVSRRFLLPRLETMKREISNSS